MCCTCHGVSCTQVWRGRLTLLPRSVIVESRLLLRHGWHQHQPCYSQVRRSRGDVGHSFDPGMLSVMSLYQLRIPTDSFELAAAWKCMLYFSNFNCQLKLKHLEFCYFIHLVDYHGILQHKMRFNVKNLPPSVNSANAGDYRLNSFLEPFASNGNSFFAFTV